MGMFKGSNIKSGYAKLRIGMSRKEVISIFGEPDSVRKRGNEETLSWCSREFKGFLRGGSIERKVIVEFENGVVCGYDGENIDASIL